MTRKAGAQRVTVSVPCALAAGGLLVALAAGGLLFALANPSHIAFIISWTATVGAMGGALLFAGGLRLREDMAARALLRQLGPVQTHRIEESIELAHPPETVWWMVYDPERATLLSPKVSRSYRVPGTPDGVGEQHATVYDNGRTTVVEVVESDRPRRAVVKIVDPPPPVPVRVTWDLEPLGDGCLLTFGQEYDAPSSAVRPEADVAAWRRGTREDLDRLREVLDQA